MPNPEKIKSNTETSEQEELDALKLEILGDEDPDKKLSKNSNGESHENSRFEVKGNIHIGKIVIPDYADVASPNVASFLAVDASDSKTGLGLTAVRIDDFNKDPANPASQITVINPHWDKSFVKSKGNDGKNVEKKQFGVSLNSEFAFVDKDSGLNGLTTKVAGSYSPGKGWNFEGAYFHGFNKGPDSDAFRATVEKEIDRVLLTAQGWYKSDYKEKFFGRVIADIKIGNGFSVQLSCVWKNGKLEPTSGVCYTFDSKDSKKNEK